MLDSKAGLLLEEDDLSKQPFSLIFLFLNSNPSYDLNNYPRFLVGHPKSEN
jgi:hypothetical protein